MGSTSSSEEEEEYISYQSEYSPILSQDNQKLLYVLKLEHNKYYVGITNDLQESLNEHERGIGCEWTIKHKYIDLEYFVSVKTNVDEEVKKLIKQYGIDNARGGSYSDTILTDKQKAEITGDKFCVRCGRLGHDKIQCCFRTMKCGVIFIEDLNYCAKCGREEHSNGSYANYQCKNLTNRNGYKISCFYCERCGRIDHSISDCSSDTKYDGSKI